MMFTFVFFIIYLRNSWEIKGSTEFLTVSVSATHTIVWGNKYCKTPINDSILSSSIFSLTGEFWGFAGFIWFFTLEIKRGKRCDLNLFKDNAHCAKIGKNIEDAVFTTIEEESFKAVRASSSHYKYIKKY